MDRREISRWNFLRNLPVIAVCPHSLPVEISFRFIILFSRKIYRINNTIYRTNRSLFDNFVTIQFWTNNKMVNTENIKKDDGQSDRFCTSSLPGMPVIEAELCNNDLSVFSGVVIVASAVHNSVWTNHYCGHPYIRAGKSIYGHSCRLFHALNYQGWLMSCRAGRSVLQSRNGTTKMPDRCQNTRLYTLARYFFPFRPSHRISINEEYR